MLLDQPEKTTLYRSSNYIIRQNIVNDSAVTVVTFSPRETAHDMDGSFFAERFLGNYGINAVGVIPSKNDWYQGEDIGDVIQTIVGATQGHTRIGYGGSMGAYGVINFSEALGLDSVVAISAQFSVDPEKVPFEARWQDERADITFRADMVGHIAPMKKGYLVYDRMYEPDRLHAELITRTHGFETLHFPFSEHLPLLFLNDTGLITDIALQAISSSLDQVSIRQKVRSRRRQSAWYFLQISKHMMMKGNLGAAARTLHIASNTPNNIKDHLDYQTLMLTQVVRSQQDIVLPSGFDGVRYLSLHPDVCSAGMAPELHYLGYGARERRAF